jgi:light-regulated signal transduction histidine kinase (bacteriophytochrome)
LAERLLKTVEQLEEEINERKRMERKIKKYSRELERSNKELEAFAYVASHDLQEPLRAISSYLQLVEKRYKDKLDEKGRDFIERVVNSTHRMQAMINDLLGYSRITTRGKSFAKHSLEMILQQALTNLTPEIEQKKAVITYDTLPELACDDSQMIRLFQNLISNAVKFCETPVPQIHISAEQQKSEWLFSVKDNGIGIDPSHQKSIFKIFHRLHGRGTYPGTGIGLAICQKIVERHGGKIEVESEPGSGSTFFFTLKIKLEP